MGDGRAARGYSSAMSTLRPFHIAFPVHDLAAARAFYGGVLGCPEGRSSDEWIDFDLFGHQIVAHLKHGMEPESAVTATNAVDGHDVPVPHFGVVLTMADWQALADRVERAGIAFGIAPHVRFAGLPGEQATMFFRDASGNALEFKAFADLNQLFATD
ncbi:MAG: bleomycin resistance protein [Sphingomonas bacterium]|jgi:extradiol dioxygenase family protein|nr:bleomycin resistance protein [Sphingomonas bacterium]MDB5719228.1 bleomycin resistance protein [Sphingomonas bacterium]